MQTGEDDITGSWFKIAWLRNLSIYQEPSHITASTRRHTQTRPSLTNEPSPRSRPPHRHGHSRRATPFPDRQAIALCGDGGIAMLMGDLLTIADRRLPVKLVVFNNSHLGFVRIEQMEAGIAPFGTELKNPNFAKVAEALGITGFRLEQAAEVRSTVEQFLNTSGPALLDAVVDPNALSLPPHATFGEAENFSLSLAKQAIQGNLDDVIATIKDNALLV